MRNIPDFASLFRTMLGANTYLLLLQQPDSKWKDKEGLEYNYSDTVVNYKVINPGAKVVFFNYLEGRMSFIGHEIVSVVTPTGNIGNTPTGRPKNGLRANLRNYSKISLPELKSFEAETKYETFPTLINKTQ